MIAKTRMNVDRQRLALKIQKDLTLSNSIRIYFFIIKTKSSPSTSFIIFSTIAQILKTILYIFGKIGPSCSHKLAIFFKHQMPLTNLALFFLTPIKYAKVQSNPIILSRVIEYTTYYYYYYYYMQADRYFRKKFFFPSRISKREYLIKTSKVIFHIKPILSHC